MQWEFFCDINDNVVSSCLQRVSTTHFDYEDDYTEQVVETSATVNNIHLL